MKKATSTKNKGMMSMEELLQLEGVQVGGLKKGRIRSLNSLSGAASFGAGLQMVNQVGEVS